jgi:hypothetical protein
MGLEEQEQEHLSNKDETTAGFEWANICKEKVVASAHWSIVIRTEIAISNLTGGRFRGAINNGFTLDWKLLKNCG